MCSSLEQYCLKLFDVIVALAALSVFSSNEFAKLEIVNFVKKSWFYLKKIQKVEVPWWIYFYPAPFRGNWLLEIMCRTLLQRYIKSSPSDIDWCVVTVVRYHVCQHFNLAARRSRSFNNWNCKYIHTCLKRSSRIIRLIRSATATFFLPNLWRTSWKSPQSQPLHIVCCDAMAANYACAHFFATCQFIIRSNPATFQRLGSLLGYVSVTYFNPIKIHTFQN